MSSSQKVSIIINNYNYGRFLKEAIDSALNQTYPNTEVIVVDDGSTDNSHEIIAEYGKQIIPILKENRGQPSAFNAGFKVSTGTIVLFLDADDMLLPSALASFANLFEMPEVVKVHWALWEIDGDGYATNRLVPSYSLSEGDLRQMVIDRGPAGYATPPTSGNAWAKAFLEQAFPVPECGDKHGADAYLCMLAPIYGRIIRLDKPQGYYRTHLANFSGHNTAHRIKRDINRFDLHADILAKHIYNKDQIIVNVECWKEKSWIHQVHKAIEQITFLIPKGEKLILVDQDEWGKEILPNHIVLPFLERNGQYWGQPTDDEIAIRELLRLKESGARFIVFTNSTFWWLDFYRGLYQHLCSKYGSLLKNDQLIIFDLSS